MQFPMNLVKIFRRKYDLQQGHANFHHSIYLKYASTEQAHTFPTEGRSQIK
jgi:hypothetical protein